MQPCRVEMASTEEGAGLAHSASSRLICSLKSKKRKLARGSCEEDTSAQGCCSAASHLLLGVECCNELCLIVREVGTPLVQQGRMMSD